MSKKLHSMTVYVIQRMYIKEPLNKSSATKSLAVSSYRFNQSSNPTFFRIDKIQKYRRLSEKFKVPYAKRFEEGEFRKRVQFMHAGELQSVTLKYYSENPKPVLDFLPTARILEQNEHECTVEAEVYGNGIVKWILSHRSKIEVLRPESLREEIKQVLHDMLHRYE